MNRYFEPFKLAALERLSKIIGEVFTGVQLTDLFRKAGIEGIVHDGSTKWRFLYQVFEELQKKHGRQIILKFLETACDPQEYFGRQDVHVQILKQINEVLNFYGIKIDNKGNAMTDEKKQDDNPAQTPRPPYTPPSGFFKSAKEMEEEIRAAKAAAIPRAITNPSRTTSPATAAYRKEWVIKHRKEISGSTIVGILAILVTVFWPMISNSIFPPTPEINVTDLTAVNGNVEGKNPRYLYSALSYVPNGTMSETFSVIVTNTGEAPVKNFWIRFDWEPSGDWLDFSSSGINSQIPAQRCPQKSSECTIELITKEMGPVELHYSTVIDHKKYLDTTEPKIILRYSHDNEPEKQIIVDVFMGR